MIILIADDDWLVRCSLKSMLLDIDKNYILEEACNGKELVQKTRALRPDVAFVDINMPVIDGISAIAECRKYSHHTQYVVLTAYAEFTYAKQSLRLSVTDYLLKPAAPEELAAVMARLSANLASRLKASQKSYQMEVTNKFAKWGRMRELPYALPGAGKEGGRHCLAVFFPENYCHGENGDVMLQTLITALEKLEDPLVGRGVKMAVAMPTVYAAYGVFNYSGSGLPTALAKVLADLCRPLADSGSFISGAYAAANDLETISRHYHWLNLNPQVRYLLPEGRIVPCPDFTDAELELAAAGKADGLLTAFANYDEVLFEKNLRELTPLLDRANPDCLKNIAAHVTVRCDFSISGESGPVFLSGLRKLGRAMLPPAHLPQSGKISKIQQYIDENYMNDININSLARQFALTPNYLSTLFHEKNGKRFIEYLTDVRMANAIKILARCPGTPVKELAELVGYTSAPYFSSLFKKHTGFYPSEYGKRKD